MLGQGAKAKILPSRLEEVRKEEKKDIINYAIPDERVLYVEKGTGKKTQA